MRVPQPQMPPPGRQPGVHRVLPCRRAAELPSAPRFLFLWRCTLIGCGRRDQRGRSAVRREPRRLPQGRLAKRRVPTTMAGQQSRASWKRREREPDDRRRYRGTHLRGPRRSPDLNRRAGRRWKAPLWRALTDAGLTLAWVPEQHGGAGASSPRVRGARRRRPVCGAGSARRDHAGRLAAGARRDFLTARPDDGCAGATARPRSRWRPPAP